MAAPYIYVITDSNRNCYVGQSMETSEVSENGKVLYPRLYQHAANAYYGTKGAKDDASVPMFQQFPLVDLYMKVIPEGGSGSYYGIPEKTYYTFLEYFTPKGGEKTQKDSKKGGESPIKVARNAAKEITITVKNAQGENEKRFKQLTAGQIIDIAEILWMSRFQAKGYNLLNKVIGGQRAGWTFIGKSGTESVNISTSPPSRLTSMLWSTEADAQEGSLMQKMQNDIDALFDKYLDLDMGNLIIEQIENDTNSRKNLFNPKVGNVKEMPLKPILEDAIFRVLSNKGGATKKDKSGHAAKFKQELIDLIISYGKQGLESFGFSTRWEGAYFSLIENIAQKLASSLLEINQNKKFTKSFSMKDLGFRTDGKNIVYKGNKGQGTSQTISVTLDQSFNLKTYNTQKGSWWFDDSETHGYHLTDSIKWGWALNMFHQIFLRVRQPELGLLAQSKVQAPLTIQGNVAVVQMSSDENSLSGRMLEYYRSHLSWSNRIFKTWDEYFGRLYGILAKAQQWGIETAEVDGEPKQYAVLLNSHAESKKKKKGRQQQEPSNFIIGFELTKNLSFDINQKAMLKVF